MTDSEKTREQLIEELRSLRQQLGRPEPADSRPGLVPADFAWLLDEALHPITVYDRDAIILFVNLVGARNLGHPRDDILGRPLGEFLPGAQEMAARRNSDVLDADEPLFFEDSLELPTGTRTFFSVLQRA